MEPERVDLILPESVDITAVLGISDRLLRRIENHFDAMIMVRERNITLIGTASEIQKINSVFMGLIDMAKNGKAPSSDDLDLLLDKVDHGASLMDFADGEVILSFKGKQIFPKTKGQKLYCDAVRSHVLTFCTGPAGTGKTYLAMALAVSALKRKEVSRIVLARPVVEAGESLGFLPGSMQEKLDPYMRPLYDALFDMYDRQRALDLLDEGIIEIVPLAFMRGRSFNNTFVILDEAQNTTAEQMKMAVTRLGYSSKFVINGDMSQRDVEGEGGLESAIRILGGIEDIAFVTLDRNDVVRHSLVAKIIDAYAAHERRRGV